MIETERLKIYVASRDAMEKLIELQTDEVLKAAYTEMLDGCLKQPDQWEWYAVWMIERKDGTNVGDLCFKGMGPTGAVEIGYGILEAYEGNGYATEAVAAAVRWAGQQPGVVRVEAETEPGNIASQRVLEKCGFAADGTIGKEGPRFVWKR